MHPGIIRRGADGYIIEGSGLFTSGSELSSTYSITAPWTFSALVKRSALGAEELVLGATGGEIHFNANNTIEAEGTSSTAVFRDPSAWCHLHVSNNGVYINGTEVIAAGSVTTTDLTNAKLFDDFEGYACEIHLQSGTRAVTDFGEETDDGYWLIKNTASIAGEHYIPDPSTGTNLGSGSDWTPTSVTATNDSPTDDADNGYGNYCVWNPNNSVSNGTISNGNLTLEDTNSSAGHISRGTLGIISGKWYWEIERDNANNSSQIGVMSSDISLDDQAAGTGSNEYGYYYESTGELSENGSKAAWGNTWTTGDIIGIAYDADTGKLWFSKNGVWENSGDPVAGTSPATTVASPSAGYLPWARTIGAGGIERIIANFGQQAFNTTPPTGFKALATQNMPDASIPNPADHFFQDSVVKSGDTNFTLGWNADTYHTGIMVCVETTASTAVYWFDTMEGVGSYYDIASGGSVTALANGISISGETITMGSGFADATYSIAAFKFGLQGSEEATPDSASLTCTVSANATAGQSLVKYTGATSPATTDTYAHGLDSAPEMIWAWNDDTSAITQMYHTTIGIDKETRLSDTTTASTNTNFWPDLPTATLVKPGATTDLNNNGSTHTAINFHSVDGYSFFGGYVGNATADNAMITANLQPQWVMICHATSNNDKNAWQASRDPDNSVTSELDMGTGGVANDSTDSMLFLSNGLKITGTGSQLGASATYALAMTGGIPIQGGSKAVTQGRAR